jgi:RNA polymerase sigma-70 factor (ECF subfamily)
VQRSLLPPQSAEPSPHEKDDAALFNRYGSLIFAYVLKHTKTREDAEDLTLEIFTAALEKNNLAHIKPEEQLAWLKRVAHNKLIDVYRKAERNHNVNIDSFAETLFSTEDPEQIVLLRESHHQLHEQIQQLTPLQQQILYLRYAHNMRYAEIGNLLNKSEAAIRQLLTRTRILLRTNYRNRE